MAWSGDVSQMQLYDNPDVEFVIPETGGMLFVDNMMIPNGVAASGRRVRADGLLVHARGGSAADRVHRLLQPGRGRRASECSRTPQAARDAGDDESAPTQLEQIAATRSPTEEQLENVFNYKILTEEEERQWNDLFNEVVTG